MSKLKYGIELVEFFVHSDEELQQLTKAKETAYFRHSQTPAYPQPGVNIGWFSDKPLAQALRDLTEKLLEGYTVDTAHHRPLYLGLTLRKPSAVIDADLLELAEAAKVEYEASRYERNLAEQERQLELAAIERVQKEQARIAKASADLLAAAESGALASLLAAHAKSAKKAEAAQ